MQDRQYCTPHIVRGFAAIPLKRIHFTDSSIDENWFQELLFKSPSLIPVGEIEETFGPMIPLAREMPTPSGPVDLVYINERGFITIVETKLFRNPEARRKVVAQTLDYATAISEWSYGDLCAAVCKARKSAAEAPSDSADPVQALIRSQPEFVDSRFVESRFIDTVSDNLARGRFLLLIVGDGIQEGVERLAETCGKSPHLEFSLALLELALFKGEGASAELFIQPRLLARTREINRATIELRAGITVKDVKVSLSAEGADRNGTRRRLSEKVIFETIAASPGQPTVEQLRAFLSDAEKIGIEAQARGTSLSMTWYEPNTERRFSFATIFAEGGIVDLRFVLHNYRQSGLDEAIGKRYVNAVAALVDGSRIKENVSKSGTSWPRVFVGEREITLADLFSKASDWLDALQVAVRETAAAGAAKSEA